MDLVNLTLNPPKQGDKQKKMQNKKTSHFYRVDAHFQAVSAKNANTIQEYCANWMPYRFIDINTLPYIFLLASNILPAQ